MRIINQTRNTILAQEVEIAGTFCKRMTGLLGRRELKQGAALLIKPSGSVHTFFMRFSIDVLFVGRKNSVVAAISEMKPFRASRMYLFCDAIELPAGTIEKTQTQKGDLIQVG